MAIKFEIEWLDAPSVRTPVLSKTWARLRISAGSSVVTSFYNSRAQSVQEGVYVSTWPLARWIIENWWFIVSERSIEPDPLGSTNAPGPTSTTTHELRDWRVRHCPAYSREGMAYPFVYFVRGDDWWGVRWTSREFDAAPLMGRFVGEGFCEVERDNLERELMDFVDATLGRLDGLSSQEVARVRELWAAVQASRRDEPTLCARLAALHLDPYGEEYGEDLLDGLEQLPWDEHVVDDMLSGARPHTLAKDVAGVRLLSDLLVEHARTGPVTRLLDPGRDFLPYRAGYRRAQIARRSLGLSASAPVADLTRVMAEVTGGSPYLTVGDVDAPGIVGVVSEALGLAARSSPSPMDQRFLQARGLHHWNFVHFGDSGIRLLTKARDWEQAASRAFAAEFLAPAEGVAQMLDESGEWSDTSRIAEHFGVSNMVVAYQVYNQGLR